MAIQVSGTTVIDDSRNLLNVIGLKTINSTSILGSGNIVAGATSAAGIKAVSSSSTGSQSFGFTGRFLAVGQLMNQYANAGTGTGTGNFTNPSGSATRNIYWIAVQS